MLRIGLENKRKKRMIPLLDVELLRHLRCPKVAELRCVLVHPQHFLKLKTAFTCPAQGTEQMCRY